jgi:hypothetical protein
MNEKSRIELRNFRWVLTRTAAIIAIKNEERIGLAAAKDIYEHLDKFVNDGIYIIEAGSTWGEYNYTCFLDRLKRLDVLDFVTYDSEDEKEKERMAKEAEYLKKAKKWVLTLTPDEQAMVKTLMDSVSVVIACGG